MGPAHAALGAGTAAANVEAMTCPRALLLLLLFPVLACDPGAPNAPPSTDDAPEDTTEAAPSAATAGTGALWPGAIAYQDDCAAGEFDPYALCGTTVAEGVAEWNRRVGFLPAQVSDFDRPAFRALMRHLYAPYVEDVAYDFARHKPQETFRQMFTENPNLFKLDMPADAVFLNRITFGLVSLLTEIGSPLNCYRLADQYFSRNDPDWPEDPVLLAERAQVAV